MITCFKMQRLKKKKKTSQFTFSHPPTLHSCYLLLTDSPSYLLILQVWFFPFVCGKRGKFPLFSVFFFFLSDFSLFVSPCKWWLWLDNGGNSLWPFFPSILWEIVLCWFFDWVFGFCWSFILSFYYFWR